MKSDFSSILIMNFQQPLSYAFHWVSSKAYIPRAFKVLPDVSLLLIFALFSGASCHMAQYL